MAIRRAGVRGRRYRVIAFDYVGAGHSDLGAYDPQRYSSLAGYAADVIEICEEFDLHDVVFVGHSVSAMIGALVAIAEPDLFAKLVMVGPSPRYIDADDYVGGFDEADIDELLASLDSNYLGWSSAMAPAIMGNADRPELGTELTESFCRTDPEVARQFAARHVHVGQPSRPRPRERADAGAAMPRRHHRSGGRRRSTCSAHSPTASWCVLDATGHCPHLSAPDADDRGDRGLPCGMTRRGRPHGVRAASSTTATLYAEAPCGYLSTSSAGVIVRVNDTFLDWTGYRREDLLGVRRFVDLLTVGGQLYHETHYMPLLQMQSTAREIAFEIVCADGDRMPVLVNAVLKRDCGRTRLGGPGRTVPGHGAAGVRARTAEGQAARRGVRIDRSGDGEDAAGNADSAGAATHRRARHRRHLSPGRNRRRGGRRLLRRVSDCGRTTGWW